MPPFRASIFTTCCLAGVLLAPGCGARPAADGAGGEGATSTPAARNTRIAGITEIEGQTLIELAVGSAGGIDTATFFRVYDGQRAGVIKAMLKVQEVLGPNQCIAIMIGGLFDTENPLAVGDPVTAVTDLALIGGGHALEREVRMEQHRLDLEDTRVRQAFDRMREEYQQRLRGVVEERDRALVDLQAGHERELLRLSRDHERTLAQKDLERRSDLAALRTTMLGERASEVQQARREGRDRIHELERERDALQAQVDSLIAEQARLMQRITELVEREGELRRHHAAALRAEVETRSILEQRLQHIEHNLNPDPIDATAMSTELDRSETILERLDRVGRERDRAQRQNELLRGQVEQLRQQLALSGQRLEQATARLDAIRQQQEHQDQQQQRQTELETALTQAREHLDAAQLARMESERQYYELILRVLRLPEGKTDALQLLKDRLRDLALPPGDRQREGSR